MSKICIYTYAYVVHSYIQMFMDVSSCAIRYRAYLAAQPVQVSLPKNKKEKSKKVKKPKAKRCSGMPECTVSPVRPYMYVDIYTSYMYTYAFDTHIRFIADTIYKKLLRTFLSHMMYMYMNMY